MCAQEFQGLLYVGGAFASTGSGLLANNIVSLNSTWGWGTLPAPSGGGVGLNGQVRAMTVFQGKLWMLGTFTDFGTTGVVAAASRPYALVGWTGSNWALPGCGTCYTLGSNGGSMWSLAVFGDLLVIGGGFSSMVNPHTGAALSANRLLTWDGATGWGVMRTGMTNGMASGYVYAHAVAGKALIAGGYFSFLSDGTSANNLAIWS